jgi:hypothetical protein
MSEEHYSCRYCGRELQKGWIGDSWAYVCPSPDCKAAPYPTAPKETGDGSASAPPRLFCARSLVASAHLGLDPAGSCPKIPGKKRE